jgi:hypothetical protein
MSTTKFYKFNVNGNEFKCFYTLLSDYGVVSIKSGACWCDRTIRFDADGKPFFTWNGKTIFMDDLVETDF